VQRVIHKNFYQFAKLRITVYRESPGLYTPMSNNMGFVIEGVRYDRRNYTFNPEGVTLGLYDELPKSVDALSNCKTTSALVYVMASIFKKEKQLDDVIILNANDKVCETSNANLFYVKDNKVYTPGLDQGCIAGVLRKQIVSCCKSLNIVLKETSVTLEDLLDADEIFITNMTAGVQGVNCLEIDGETYRKKLQLAKQFQTFFS
jgi:branched-subunit amino acid aminotransferase/4-amino-4-deoxychorismate lyase